MQNLQVLINQLEKGRNLHISILDFSGILNDRLTKIAFANVIHSKPFCNIAKSTPQGFRTCIRCKMLANKKAVSTKTPFCGQCSYGLYEVGYPVVIDDSVQAIVYVGNAIFDAEIAKEKIEKTCALTKVCKETLCQELDNCERIESSRDLYEIAEITADYLKMLCAHIPSEKSNEHWLIVLMKRYAQSNIEFTISLKEFAVSHKKNEQYVGRLFKKHVGISFHQYCNEIRLNKAKTQLLQTNDPVIEIALNCGYNNISYFNKIFKNKFAMAPSEYRKSHQK